MKKAAKKNNPSRLHAIKINDRWFAVVYWPAGDYLATENFVIWGDNKPSFDTEQDCKAFIEAEGV